MNTRSKTTKGRLGRATVATTAALALAGLGTLGISAMSATAARATSTSAGAATTPATAPYCGISWGSLPKSASAYSVEYVTTVRMDGSGQVVPLRGGAKLQIVARSPAYDMDYNVTYDPPDWSEAVNVAGYSTFRQVAWAGSFEGQSTVGLGVRARLPFRVFTLSDAAYGSVITNVRTGRHPCFDRLVIDLNAADAKSSRLVVDVAHYWS